MASQGRKGDLSRFIEEAVRKHIFELTADQIKSANIDISEANLLAIIEKAVNWARNR